ncbi:Holliday junction resolvase RuvX [Buchnera aphidicola (Mindarus keteleerifoliae)]|uniref:Holliday junction resolvase RuvX n=1 Tax=Buchnera aphidicola TaxID=9 RepID=UPI0031B676FF
MIALSFDYGTKIIGVAVGETLFSTTKALNHLQCIKNYPDWNVVNKLISYWEPNILIVGFPIYKNKKKQNITKKTKKFANILKHKYQRTVILHNEYLTTIEAKNFLFNKGGFKALKKGKIDSISAALILESWYFSLEKT